jgi:hypothetical protein
MIKMIKMKFTRERRKRDGRRETKKEKRDS